MIRGFRTDIDIFREENVPLFTQLEELVSEYQKITGGLEVEWEGEPKTVPQLQPYLKSRDRSIRERAFRTQTTAYLGQLDHSTRLHRPVPLATRSRGTRLRELRGDISRQAVLRYTRTTAAPFTAQLKNRNALDRSSHAVSW